MRLAELASFREVLCMPSVPVEIQQIYDTGLVAGKSGRTYEVRDAIDHEEGDFLFNLIRRDPTIRRTLEVGCAHGVSSLYICSALRGRDGASHTILDPFQYSEWDAVGITALERAGIDFFHLIERRSELALPLLLDRMEGAFDFVFVDGWHTFDHALLDCFYATRLLRVGGYLAIDDVAAFQAVRRAVEFLSNYPCYELHGSVSTPVPRSWKNRVVRTVMAPVNRRTWADILSARLYRRVFDDLETRMVALKKVAEDRRNWDWHDETPALTDALRAHREIGGQQPPITGQRAPARQ
jgi:predicted O-methyltransferase YrrM